MIWSDARGGISQASQRHIASHVTCDAGPLRASHVTPPFRGDDVTRGAEASLGVDFLRAATAAIAPLIFPPAIPRGDSRQSDVRTGTPWRL